MKPMNACLIALLAASTLLAADEQHLALALKSQTDYDRVALSVSPQLSDTNACVQTQAAMLTIATPEELPTVHFRKGYCTLALGSITRDAATFSQAATEFDKATETWNARNVLFAKKRAPEPNPSVFPVLAAIARFAGGKTEGKEIESAVAAHVCPVSVMPAERCETVLQAGREWLGWAALRRDDTDEAARQFPPTSTAWTNWVAGKRAFRDRNYADAAAGYRRSVEAWEAEAHSTTLSLWQRLSPPADRSLAYTEQGGAQLLAGDAAGAVATLTQAIRRNPANAKAYYLRARAKDTAGQFDAAIADYSLASRNAMASGEDQTGNAHLYLGISLYRKKDYQRAEDEFTNSLNFEFSAASRADAVAWRRLSAVAEGSCDAGRKYLEEALPAVSPFFPKDEAHKLMDACAAISRVASPER